MQNLNPPRDAQLWLRLRRAVKSAVNSYLRFLGLENGPDPVILVPEWHHLVTHQAEHPFTGRSLAATMGQASPKSVKRRCKPFSKLTLV